MGSTHLPLDLPERLRPWAALGLEHVLLPGSNLGQETLLAKGSPPVSPTGRQRPGPGSPRGAASRPTPRPGRPSSFTTQPGRPAFSASSGQVRPQHGRADQRFGASGSPVHPDGGAPRPDFPAPGQSVAPLPAHWQTLVDRVVPGARIVWTYQDLGQDMGGRPDPQRRELLKRLQAYLGWPAGTIAYIPTCEYNNASNELIPRPELFWQAVRGLNIRSIACFGQRAFRTICPGAGRGSIHFTQDDFTVHIMQGPNLLLNMRECDQTAQVERLRDAIR